jgi:hypothetical protein
MRNVHNIFMETPNGKRPRVIDGGYKNDLGEIG